MTLADAALAALRVRVTRVFPMQVHTVLDKLTEEQLWWRPNEKSNSIANLIIHLSGSLDHYLNRGIGGIPYDRDRDAEFAARGPQSKAQLLERLDGMVARAETTFAGIPADRLMSPSADPDRYQYLIDDLINIATHLATHVGQIVWIAKMLNEGSLDETWMRTHKRGGAWK